ncbi:MAG: type II secretion system F family protein [Magnetococcales bacterium]|nr:type II secretion system F family protein [Magnetococcales bacterium]
MSHPPSEPPSRLLIAMPTYHYKGRKIGGAQVTGQLSAQSTDAVVEALLKQSIQPLEIKVATAQKGELKTSDIGLFAEWPTEDDVILFTRQMYSLSKAGVPVIRSLQGLTESTHNKKLVEAMNRIIERLQGGTDLSGAMNEHPRIFGQIYIRVVRIGESTGRMEEAFDQLYKYLSVEKETRKKVKSAMRYPTFVVIAITIAMGVLNYFVIPKFEGVFKQFKSELPLPTRILMGTSKFTINHGVEMLVFILLAVFSFRYYIRTPKGKLWWDEKKLTLPLAGSILNRATLGRFARSFAMGSRSGLPIVQTMNAVAEAVDNTFVESKVKEIRKGIERGESMLQSCHASGLFTPLVLQMMAVGEETGNMDEMMQEVAEFYEREVEYDVSKLSSSIEPIMLGVIGVMVLMLALGIFLPMWEMGSAALKKH